MAMFPTFTTQIESFTRFGLAKVRNDELWSLARPWERNSDCGL